MKPKTVHTILIRKTGLTLFVTHFVTFLGHKSGKILTLENISTKSIQKSVFFIFTCIVVYYIICIGVYYAQ